MKKTARSFQPKGFTLVEFLIFAGVFGILLGLSTAYLFGTREKALLELERDRLVGALKIAQQEAISAYRGYEYGVRFETSKQYTPISINPNTAAIQVRGKTVIFPSQIEISPFTPTAIKFQRLTGKPDSSLSLTLVSKRFKVEIQVSGDGIITATRIEKR